MITTKKEIIIETGSNNNSKQTVLALDVIISILERLSFVDFHRARCISSEWYFASRSCIQGRTNPWLIFFPKVDGEIKNDTCKLFNPRDKNIYTVRDLGFDFASCRCFASCGNWFLMLENANFHLLNVFTRERIPLPSLELIDGIEMTFMRMTYSDFYVTLDYKDKASQKNPRVVITGVTGITKAVLWVDEKNKNYFVVWSNGNFLAYHKRGDDNNNERWKVLQHLKNEGCVDMVFKESKLYVLRANRGVTVFYFSHGDSPMEFAILPSPLWNQIDQKDLNNLAVTLSGDILIISCTVRYPWSVFDLIFNIYKLDPKSSGWKRIEFIGDEALLLDVGITVAAKGGVVKNCIYFSKDKLHVYNRYRGYEDDKSNYAYDMESKKVFKVCEHLMASDARWFLPTFGGE